MHTTSIVSTKARTLYNLKREVLLYTVQYSIIRCSMREPRAFENLAKQGPNFHSRCASRSSFKHQRCARADKRSQNRWRCQARIIEEASRALFARIYPPYHFSDITVFFSHNKSASVLALAVFLALRTGPRYAWDRADGARESERKRPRGSVGDEAVPGHETDMVGRASRSYTVVWSGCVSVT